MSQSVQYKGTTDWVMVSAANPLPVVISTASGTQPTIWTESVTSTTTPVPCVIS